MAHKALLIGLGSSGSDMVSRAVERVFEHHGGLGSTPWLRVLAIDTAPISGEVGDEGWRMAQTDNVVNIGLDGQQYAKFLGHPNDAADIDFARWASQEVFKGAGSTHQGAKGKRMIGRGSFLHAASLGKVYSAVQSRLQALDTVDLVQELQERGMPPLPSGSDPNAIRIFVCGSLTGGTSSGSFIDLGYLLQAMGDFKKYLVYGIFTLPHPNCGNQAAMANAYTAVRELNHYLSDGVRYRQRVPLPARFSGPIAPPPGATPYQGTMVIMARTGKKDDIDPMHEAVGEFLYAATCSNIADVAFQKMVDPSAQYMDLRVRNMHLRFQTLGSASLVFPAEHIARGAACRLVADALGEWLGKPALPVADGLTLLNQMGLTRRGIRDGLLQPAPGRSSITHEIDNRIDAAIQQCASDNLDFRQTAEGQIEDGFESRGVIEGSIGARVVPQTVKSNKSAVQSRWIEELRKKIDQALLDLGRLETVSHGQPDRGPHYAIGLCQAALRRIADIRAEIAGPSAHQAVEAARSGVEEQWDQLERANSKSAKLLGWAGGGRAVAAPRWGEAAKAYWQARLDAACYHETAEVLTEVEKFLKRTLLRLQGSADADAKGGSNPNCLLKVAGEVRQKADEEFTRLNTQAPRLNGQSMFEPGVTVPQEHAKAMESVEETDSEGFVNIDPTRKDEAFARAWTIRAWPLLSEPPASDTDAPTYWITTDRPSPFDPPATGTLPGAHAHSEGVRHQLDRTLVPPIRRFYADLGRRNVLEMVYGHADQPNPSAGGIVQAVVDAAAPFLSIDDANTPLGVPGHGDSRTPQFAFSLNADSETPPYSHFRSALDRQGVATRISIIDPTRAIVLRTRTTFAPGMIHGIDALAAHERQLRKHEGIQGKSGRSPYESRKDVAWKTLDGSPLHPNLESRIGLLLFGLAVQAIRMEGGELVIQTNDPARRLEPDLERAGLVLCDNLTLSAFLDNALAQWALPHHATELAAKVNDFVRNFEVRFPSLEYAGETAASGHLGRDMENLLLDLLEKKAPDALAAYDDYIGLDEPFPTTYRLEEGTVRKRDEKVLSLGYYCLVCQAFLAHIGEEEKLPMVCPECGAKLFRPGWRRRWGKQRSGATGPGGYQLPSTPAPPLSTTTSRPVDDV
ncbi:tubulin-like doman-containing protein [soil metagenome]